MEKWLTNERARDLMRGIYENALHEARRGIWEDEAHFAPVIEFCKSKLRPHWEARAARAWESRNWGALH